VKRILDVLLGRSRPQPLRDERLFAISTAQVTLEARLRLQPSGRAGLCFRPVEASRFQEAEAEVRGMLDVAGRAAETRVEVHPDTYGFLWIVLEDPDFEDLVAAAHMATQTLRERGFGEQVLAVVFGFVDENGQPLYWVYNYKRGTFYPFAPRGSRQRDNALELRLGATMERELPVDPEHERWYALWDLPV
jgi:hypothetical protein